MARLFLGTPLMVLKGSQKESHHWSQHRKHTHPDKLAAIGEVSSSQICRRRQSSETPSFCPLLGSRLLVFFLRFFCCVLLFLVDQAKRVLGNETSTHLSFWLAHPREKRQKFRRDSHLCGFGPELPRSCGLGSGQADVPMRLALGSSKRRGLGLMVFGRPGFFFQSRLLKTEIRVSEKLRTRCRDPPFASLHGFG